jgi:hypothetical protein
VEPHDRGALNIEGDFLPLLSAKNLKHERDYCSGFGFVGVGGRGSDLEAIEKIRHRCGKESEHQGQPG